MQALPLTAKYGCDPHSMFTEYDLDDKRGTVKIAQTHSRRELYEKGCADLPDLTSNSKCKVPRKIIF